MFPGDFQKTKIDQSSQKMSFLFTFASGNDHYDSTVGPRFLGSWVGSNDGAVRFAK